MKFLTYISLSFLLLTISLPFIESKTTKRDSDSLERKLKKKRIPFGPSSSPGSFSRSSFHVNVPKQHGSSLSHSDNQGLSSALSLDFLADKKPNKNKSSYKPSKMTKSAKAPEYKGPIYDGPRRRGILRGRPGAYGYYTGRFPVWLTSYAYIMEDLVECPRTHEGLYFLEQFDRCLGICTKHICIRVRDYCCYYVSPAKYAVIIGRK